MAPRQPDLTLGVEEEYLLVDLESRDLVKKPPGSFMATCQAKLGGRVTHELLQSQIEIGTSICKDVAGIRTELADLRGTIADIAKAHGMGLLAVSTHPSASWHEQQSVNLERYRILTRDFQAIARRLVVCGMHVHAGIADDDLRIDLMNQVTYFLPHLLALSASSPFWEGHDTGLRSFRPTIFGDLPRSGMPEHFDSFSDYQKMLDDMAECGVCDDPSKIWWDVRPSAKNPTLEMRICDVCTRLEDAVTIAALYQATLAALFRLRQSNQQWRRYRTILIEENKWRAQRYGIGGELADYGQGKLVPFAELVEEWCALVSEDAERLGCAEEVINAREIIERGTSADRQISIYNAGVEAGMTAGEARRQVIGWLLEETVHN